MFRGKHIQIQD